MTVPEPTLLTIFDSRQQCLGLFSAEVPKGWEAFDPHDLIRRLSH